jgi:hypothetical protein
LKRKKEEGREGRKENEEKRNRKEKQNCIKNVPP